MNAYFVRLNQNDEVVGLFVARSPADLAALVDEHCDPTLCDFAAAGHGGLIVPGATRARWPMKPGKSSTSTGLEKAVLTQQWQDDLDAGIGALDWQPLETASERMLRSLAKP